MKTLIQYSLILSFLLMMNAAAWAKPTAELQILKKDPYLTGPCEPCSDLVTFPEGENTADFDLRSFRTQSGYHYVYVKGPAGTTVTLFGNSRFGLDKGFLIIRKKDDRTIEVNVTDLELLPANQWIDRGPGDGEGTYSAWVRPHAHLENQIGSLKWGKWWSQLPEMESK